MDDILNRKLFRHKAQIMHNRVQGLQVGGPPKSPFTLEGIQQSIQNLTRPVAPAPQPRGLGALLTDFGPGKVLKYGQKTLQAGKKGYDIFRAAQAAREPSIASRFVGQPFTKATSRFAEKYPKTTEGLSRTYGAAETLGGGALIGSGLYDAYEGIRDENPQEVGQGIAGILGGKSFAKFGIPRVRGKELPPFSKTQDIGLPLGALYGSEFLPQGAIAEERNLIDNEIAAYESEIGRKLTDAERQKATLGLQEQIKAEKAQPIASKAEDLKFATGTIDSIDVFKNVVNANTQTADGIKNNPGPRSDEEIAATLEKQNRETIAGKDLKKLADEKDAAGDKDAKAFNKFYNDINKLTGEGDNTSNLLMLKFAMGLLGGTTNKKGFAGFAEVLGKAGEQAVDSAIVLASKEKERRADLAAAYLKNKEKNSAGNITTDRTRYLIKDPSALGGQRVEERARFKDSGYDAVAVPVFDKETGQFYPQWQQAPYDPNSVEVKGDAKQLDERRAMLQSIGGSFKMASAVKQLPENVIGSPGKIKLIKEDVLQGLSGILKSEFTPSQYNGDIDKAVNEGILSKGIYGQDPKTGEFKLIMSGEQAIREKEKLIQDLVKKNTGLLGTPSSEELRKLTEAARIEVNFAYNYANTLKAEDRLTEKNLEDAKKVSSIFGFFKSPRKVKENFRQLELDAADKFEKEVVRYQYAGGNNAYIEDNYAYMPFVAQYNQKRNQAQRQETLKKQRDQILGGIKGYE